MRIVVLVLPLCAHCVDAIVLQVRELIRDRAALEKEYASKLQALTKKATEKKAKRMPAVIFGNEPSKVWTEDTVKMR